MISLPIFDLHCDLLSYLSQDPKRTILDPTSRCSQPQMRAGNVQTQVLAAFSASDPDDMRRQFVLFQKLLQDPLFTPHILLAIENASTLIHNTPLHQVLSELETLHPLYLSLTWNGDTPLGGGTGSSSRLTEKGKHLLDWMHDKKIALDFSHASDFLAEDMLSHLDIHNLHIPVIASHSNFRSITYQERNLPDWLAQEIISRKGLIGLNLFAPFVHPTDPSALLRHIEYGLSLGGENSLCFGADFFYEEDLTSLQAKYPHSPLFFPEYANATCYPTILSQLPLSLSILEKIAAKNAYTFRDKITS